VEERLYFLAWYSDQNRRQKKLKKQLTCWFSLARRQTSQNSLFPETCLWFRRLKYRVCERAKKLKKSYLEKVGSKWLQNGEKSSSTIFLTTSARGKHKFATRIVVQRVLIGQIIFSKLAILKLDNEFLRTR
jgi:predicted RNA-binding protein